MSPAPPRPGSSRPARSGTKQPFGLPQGLRVGVSGGDEKSVDLGPLLHLPQPTAHALLLHPPAEIKWELGALHGRINPIAFQTLLSPCNLPLQPHCLPLSGWSPLFPATTPGHKGTGTVDPFYRRQIRVGSALTGEPDSSSVLSVLPCARGPPPQLRCWSPSSGGPLSRNPLHLVTHHSAGSRFFV